MAASKRVDRAAPKQEVVGETQHGKEIEIKRSRCGMFFEVGFKGGGEKPREFDGFFTSHELALNAVSMYKHRKGIE